MKILVILLLVGAATGIHIGCIFGMSNFNLIGSVYTCQVRSVNHSTSANQVSGYSGTHASGNSSVNVGAVYFPGEEICLKFNLTVLPRGFSNFFPNIVALLFAACTFSTLDGDELLEYPKLELFQSYQGNLVRIPGDFFSGNPNMKIINFSNNKIANVGEGLLDNLKNLTYVYFQNNPCIDMDVGSASLVPYLIEALASECPDTEPPVTSTIAPPPNFPERCFDGFIEVFICQINFNADEINRKIIILESRVRVLEGFEEEVEEVKIVNGFLEEKVKDLEAKVGEMKNELKELKALIESADLKN